MSVPSDDKKVLVDLKKIPVHVSEISFWKPDPEWPKRKTKIMIDLDSTDDINLEDKFTLKNTNPVKRVLFKFDKTEEKPINKYNYPKTPCPTPRSSK